MALPGVLPAPLCRVHEAVKSPIFFGRIKRHRFDAPDGSFGVLYAGDENAAFIETFGHDTGRQDIDTAELDASSMSELPLNGPLALVDLTGAGLANLGADARLCTGDIGISQRWSQAIHNHPARPDGILWRSRHDLSTTSVAIYDRAAIKLAPPRLRIDSFMSPAHTAALAALLDRYRFNLI